MGISFDTDRNLALIVLSGALTRDLILETLDATVADSRYRPGMARLWDFREADVSSLTAEAILGMAQYSLRFPPGINDVKVAFVADSDVVFGLARMFELRSEAKTPIRVFRDLNEAHAWIADTG